MQKPMWICCSHETYICAIDYFERKQIFHKLNKREKKCHTVTLFQDKQKTWIEKSDSLAFSGININRRERVSITRSFLFIFLQQTKATTTTKTHRHTHSFACILIELIALPFFFLCPKQSHTWEKCEEKNLSWRDLMYRMQFCCSLN